MPRDWALPRPAGQEAWSRGSDDYVVEHSRGTGGIAVMQGEGLTVTGHTVRDSDIAALGTWDVAREVLISGNVVLGSRNVGIEVQWNGDWDNRTRNVVVSGNLISGAAQRGVQVYHGSCGDVGLRGNDIHKGMVGVWLIDCEGVEVLGNRLLNCNLQNIWNAYSRISLRPEPRAVTVRGNTIANDDQELRIWYEGPAQAATVRYDGQTLLLKQEGAVVKEIALSALAADRADLLGQAIKKVAGGRRS